MNLTNRLNPRSKPILNPFTAIHTMHQFAQDAIINGFKYITIYVSDDEITYEPRIIDPQHQGFIWAGNPQTLIDGPSRTTAHHIYQALIRRKPPMKN